MMNHFACGLSRHTAIKAVFLLLYFFPHIWNKKEKHNHEEIIVKYIYICSRYELAEAEQPDVPADLLVSW